MTVSCSTQIRFSFQTSRQLNLDDSGTALPVVVRIYQLRNKERLEQADFQSLWKRDREVLEEDLLDRREVTLNPDMRKRIEIDLMKETEFVAVMALFRKPDGNAWKQVVRMKGFGNRSYEISVLKGAILFVEK